MTEGTLPQLSEWHPKPGVYPPVHQLPIEIQSFQEDRLNLEVSVQSAINQRRFARPTPEILYHYTDAVGLKGIAFDGELWFSDFRSTNDKTEGHVPRSRLKEIVNNTFSSHLIGVTAPVFELDKDPDFRPLQLLAESVSQRFIACFTESPDQLSQWIHYGAGGNGYRIGIDISQLKTQKIVVDQNKTVRPQIFPVVYDDSEQRKELQEFVSKLFALYQDHEPVLSANVAAKHFLETSIKELLIYGIKAWSLDFKNAHFRDEQEWRCLLQFNDPIRSSVRVRGNSLATYLPLNVDVRNIMSGPKADHESLEIVSASQHWSRKPGSLLIQMERSEVPLR